MTSIVSDSIVTITNARSEFYTIPFSQIEKIKFTRVGSGGIGLAIGVGAGLGYGIIAAIGENDEEGTYLQELGDIFIGILLAIPLGAIGSAVGSHSGKTFHIDRDYQKFQSMRNYLFEKHYIN